MRLRKATINDADFIFEAMKSLQSPPLFSFNEFRAYFELVLQDDKGQYWIYLGGSENIGYIYCTFHNIPRFLGIGVEFEEIVIAAEFRGKGYGSQFINLLREDLAKIPELRKIIIKTDDRLGAGKVYERMFRETKMITYQTFVNKI